MSTYLTFADCLTDILFRSGEDPTNAAGDYYTAAQRALVRAYHDIGGRHPFLWSRVNPPGAFSTQPPVTAGTVTVGTGSTAITFSAIPVDPIVGGNISLAGRKIKVGGWNEFYRIAAHTSGATGATLDAGFNGSGGAGKAYTVYQDEYDLTPTIGVRTIEGLWVAELGYEVIQRSEGWLRTQYPDNTTSAGWPPLHFARIGETRIRFAGYPTVARRVEYSYTRVLEEPDLAGNIPILIPANWRYVLADGGLYWLYIGLNDNRAQAAGQSYGGGVERMIDDDLRKRIGTGAQAPSTGPYG